MKNFILILASILFIVPSSFTVEIPDELIFETNKKRVILDIDPHSHILGVKFGSSKEQIIKDFGKPTGIVNLKGNSTMLIYGSRVGFFIQDNKMNGALIDEHNLLSWEVSGRVAKHPSLSSFSWVLSNGIKEGMGLDKVKGILGDKYKFKSNYNGEFTLGKCKVKLSFSHHTDEGEKDSAYRLMNIHIFLQ